jgi:hypothetical protein
VDGDPPTAICKIKGNDPAEPATGAGHEHGPGFLVSSHAVSKGRFAESERQNRILADENHSK